MRIIVLVGWVVRSFVLSRCNICCSNMLCWAVVFLCKNFFVRCAVCFRFLFLPAVHRVVKLDQFSNAPPPSSWRFRSLLFSPKHHPSAAFLQQSMGRTARVLPYEEFFKMS